MLRGLLWKYRTLPRLQKYLDRVQGRLNTTMRERGVDRSYFLVPQTANHVLVRMSPDLEGPVPYVLVRFTGVLDDDVRRILEDTPYPWPRLQEDPTLLAFQAG